MPLALVLLFVATAAHTAAQSASIRRARELSATAAGAPVTVRGTVTRYRAGRSLSLQDATGSIFAYTEATTPLSPGDLVEVSGDAGVDPEGAPSINHATYRKFGSDAPPAVPETCRVGS